MKLIDLHNSLSSLVLLFIVAFALHPRSTARAEAMGDAASLEERTGCAPHAVEVLARAEAEEGFRYTSAFLVQDCRGNRGVLLALDRGGALAEIDRIDLEELGYGLPRLRFSSVSHVDVLLLTFGFEPNQIDDTYFVRLYRLQDAELLLSAWSSDLPDFVAGAGATPSNSLVFYKDAFGIGLPLIEDVPHWPIVVRIRNNTAQIEELVRHPEVVELVLQKTEAAIAALKRGCEMERDDPCDAYETFHLRGLLPQRRSLERLRAAQPSQD